VLSDRPATHDAASDDDVGGDPACWLDRVCLACGAFTDDSDAHECPSGDRSATTRPPSTT
jgi:hypothetical protein